MKIGYFLFFLIIQANCLFAQKADCGGLYRCMRQIESYFPDFQLKDGAFKLKPNTSLSDNGVLGLIKNLEYAKLLTPVNAECRDFTTVKSFSTAYKDALLVELSAVNANIQSAIEKDAYDKAYDQTTRDLRLIKGYQILVPTDAAFAQSTANLEKIRAEIEVVRTEIRTAATMKANETMSRKATLSDLIEIFVIEVNNRIKGE
jgi:hypothetical protein